MEGLLLKIRWVLTQPSDFFLKRIDETHIRESALYAITLTFASSFLSSIVNLMLGEMQLSPLRKFFYLNLPLPGTTAVRLALLIVVYSLVLVFASYLAAFILKVWMSLFGVSASYTRVYQLMAYAATPVYVLGWMSPLVSYATWVWAIVLLVLGSRGMFGVSKRKSWLMFTLPAIVFVLGIFLARVWLASLFGGF